MNTCPKLILQNAQFNATWQTGVDTIMPGAVTPSGTTLYQRPMLRSQYSHFFFIASHKRTIMDTITE